MPATFAIDFIIERVVTVECDRVSSRGRASDIGIEIISERTQWLAQR